MGGFIVLDRSIIEWRWFKNANVFRVFVYLVLKANYKPCDFENMTIKRGQIVTSYPKISDALGITEAQARTAINNLKKTGEITVNATSKFSVVTIINYDKYQCTDRQNNSQITDKEQSNDSQITVKNQTDNSQITAIKQYKQINKENKKNNTPLPPKGGETADNSFEKFWKAYPRKKAKDAALRAWKKLKPDENLLNVILAAIEQQKQSDQWRKDKGQYIPYPATWLNGRRWEDVENDCDTGNVKSNQGESETPKYGTTF
ncbi:MAG: hypothetical protein K2J11_00155 [Oscillospiraceae bacterium]|nr:hypothetical protein [Oscillospiraceae bacterium]